MSTNRPFLAGFLAAGTVVMVASVAIAQGMQGGMGPGMQGGMGPGTMMGSGMMCPAMMQTAMGTGMSALFGSHVAPMLNLSVEDVRGYLNSQIERLKNKRLKVGEVKADDGKITAEIVTVDKSLVQRLKVDRHTGAIEYED
jgi:hypothetical protein